MNFVLGNVEDLTKLINNKDKYYLTCLHYTAKNHDFEGTKVLLDTTKAGKWLANSLTL